MLTVVYTYCVMDRWIQWPFKYVCNFLHGHICTKYIKWKCHQNQHEKSRHKILSISKSIQMFPQYINGINQGQNITCHFFLYIIVKLVCYRPKFSVVKACYGFSASQLYKPWDSDVSSVNPCLPCNKIMLWTAS